MKNKIEIKNWLTGSIIFTHVGENVTIKDTVVGAVNTDADLTGADLTGADLRSAYLTNANLGGANLTNADLRYADLRYADLGGANLTNADLTNADLTNANLGGANLTNADLTNANLGGANLGGAYLRRANLGGANLRRANLGGANLGRANLSTIKNDLFMVLLGAINEIDYLKKSIIDGKISGSTYEGKCVCLVGTIANATSSNYKQLPNIKPDSQRPIERFFLAIKEGDTPENSQFSKLALEWIEEFQKLINLKK